MSAPSLNPVFRKDAIRLTCLCMKDVNSVVGANEEDKEHLRAKGLPCVKEPVDDVQDPLY